jgi:hypothetical protein
MPSGLQPRATRPFRAGVKRNHVQCHQLGKARYLLRAVARRDAHGLLRFCGKEGGSDEHGDKGGDY